MHVYCDVKRSNLCLASLILQADGNVAFYWMGGYGTLLWSAGTAQEDWKSKGPFRLLLTPQGVSCKISEM